MEPTTLVSRLEKNKELFASLAARVERDPDCRYGPGKWTSRQVLAHLADCEFINLWRFCRAVAEPGSTVLPFEENQWAARLDYASRPVTISKDLFLAARAQLVHYVKTLGEEKLGAACMHPEKGKMSGYDWADLAVNHVDHHLSQVAAALDKREWKPAPAGEAWKFGAAPKPK